MALRIERADLVAALTTVARIVETRNTYPILANVHLSVADERLTVRGTDLDIEITTSVPADGDLATTTAPAKTLLEIVKKFPAGSEVTLELEGETLIVKSGRSRFKLAVIAASSFPDMKVSDFDAEFDVDLSGFFAPVQFAISTEATRYYLNGIYLAGAVNQLTAVATDGHRLAKHVLPSAATPWPAFAAIIIPTKTVGVVPQGEVKVAVNSEKIRFTTGHTTIISKLIEGTFPDFERVIPKGNDRLVVTSRAALQAAVDRVGTVASERGGKVVAFAVDGDVIILTVQAENDSATDEVGAEYEGTPVDSGMNARYLQDILAAVTGEKVTLAFGDSLGPILLRGDNDNWTGVQMPMRHGGGN